MTNAVSAGAPALQVLDSPDPRHVASQIAALKAKGLKAAILYISPINPAGDKTAKKPSIDAIRAAGVDVGFVCEGWGGSQVGLLAEGWYVRLLDFLNVVMIMLESEHRTKQWRVEVGSRVRSAEKHVV